LDKPINNKTIKQQKPDLDKLLQIIDIIEDKLPDNSPAHRLKQCYSRNPYTILMVTLLSLRAKDEQTSIVASKLFNTITTPQELLKVPQETLENIIKPIGMQKQKAQTLINASKLLIEKHNSKVPDDKESLLDIKGVGEKTANIVLNNAFEISNIAVDTHVHRLCNMLEIIDTKSELESSNILNDIVPQKYKSKINFTLVVFGQTICTPKKPQCDKCMIRNLCVSKTKDK
jgi:endonuclease-3